MQEQRFIAISEEEYNSFKHGEYERQIKSLEEKIEQLEKENIAIAKAKAVRLEITKEHGLATIKDTTKIQVISNEKFEDEILESIRNTEFSHIVCQLGYDAYVKIGDTCYYKNKWCEELKNELQRLSIHIERLQNEKKSLEEDVAILQATSKNTDKRNIIQLIIDTFSKNDK